MKQATEISVTLQFYKLVGKHLTQYLASNRMSTLRWAS